MHFNSREGFILTTALVAVTVLVTILLHNRLNNAIERRAKSLTSNELKSFSSIIERNKAPIREIQKENVTPVKSTPVNSTTVSFSEIPETSPPPVGSGKKWTPL